GSCGPRASPRSASCWGVANRAHARDLHLLDALAHHLALEVSAEGLDFRELGHQASSSPLGLLAVTGASGSRASGTRTACRVCQASRAAACSACFFDRPSPAP